MKRSCFCIDTVGYSYNTSGYSRSGLSINLGNTNTNSKYNKLLSFDSWLNTAYLASTELCGLGFVVRNAHGAVMACGIKQFSNKLEVHEVETVVFALESAATLSFQNIVVEKDCLLLARQFGQRSFPPTEWGNRPFNIRSLASSFDSFSSSYVRHSANVVAHQLAQIALIHTESEWVWVEEWPQIIASLILADSGA
ncbi:hypothetical protein JCGZ_23640 [Jatropha curcas]|uniref:RNase H type-1 domain-containing protein n=1 Tax=Jatropha curcas TaxID=180498 RepID=A0A067LE03_JATCU|nr:hypothetical protein JCGZ_23640 [Jatropha curcas]